MLAREVVLMVTSRHSGAFFRNVAATSRNGRFTSNASVWAESSDAHRATHVAASDNRQPRSRSGANEQTQEFGAADGTCAVRVTSVSAQKGGTNRSTSRGTAEMGSR